MRRTRESSSGESDIDCNTPKPANKAQRMASKSGENVPVKAPDKNINDVYKRSTGWISEVRKLNVVAQKRSGRPRKSWDEVIKNDRKKLDMDSADPQNRSEWRGRLRGRLVKKPNPQ